MDFTVVGGLLTVLLAAIPAVGAYFQRQTRAVRKENRLLRATVQEADLHIFTLERHWTSRGVRPPARPELLRAVGGDDADDGPRPVPPPDRSGDATGGGARHAT